MINNYIRNQEKEDIIEDGNQLDLHFQSHAILSLTILPIQDPSRVSLLKPPVLQGVIYWSQPTVETLYFSTAALNTGLNSTFFQKYSFLNKAYCSREYREQELHTNLLSIPTQTMRSHTWAFSPMYQPLHFQCRVVQLSIFAQILMLQKPVNYSL